jgi:hypothetical protein
LIRVKGFSVQIFQIELGICDKNFESSFILSKTDLGKDRGGPKESSNGDKSLHGLMVALAMAGTIAG